jgi:energy-coupling factor transport system ATP-binding protein
MALNGLLKANSVSYYYLNQKKPVINDISLTVGEGEQLLITGPSGSGKSTLARCLVGLIPHLYKGELNGHIWLDGLNTHSTPLWKLVEKAGMVLQNPQAQMLATTVEDEIIFGLENLGLASPEISQRTEEALTRFNLQHLRSRNPRLLSGGEGQRVIVDALLARRSPILILDEPLSMLDTTSAQELVDYLLELGRAGHATIVCEHRSHYFEDSNIFHEYPLTVRKEIPVKGDLTSFPLDTTPDFNLAVTDLSVTFGNRRVLNNINLDLEGGQVVALVGPNGSGKTTLLRSLVGIQGYEGTIESTDENQVDLGLVYQNPDLQLFNPTVREEILYKLDSNDERLYQWLITNLGLEQYQNMSPLLLSEGEKKRLCLSLVLMHRPKHGVLLDEPTLGQDDHHRRLLGFTVKRLAEAGRLMLVATHDLAWVVHYASQMIVLNDGKIVTQGNPVELFREDMFPHSSGLNVPQWIWGSLA